MTRFFVGLAICLIWSVPSYGQITRFSDGCDEVRQVGVDVRTVNRVEWDIVKEMVEVEKRVPRTVQEQIEVPIYKRFRKVTEWVPVTREIEVADCCNYSRSFEGYSRSLDYDLYRGTLDYDLWRGSEVGFGRSGISGVSRERLPRVIRPRLLRLILLKARKTRGFLDYNL